MQTRLNSGPDTGNGIQRISLIAGSPLEPVHHNVTRKGGRDGQKVIGLGDQQRSVYETNVQRLVRKDVHHKLLMVEMRNTPQG